MLVPLIGSGEDSSLEDCASFRLRTLLALLPGGRPFPAAMATLRPAVGGKPSGLYCVLASTYPAKLAATRPLSTKCCFGCCGPSAVVGALNARRGELAVL